METGGGSSEVWGRERVRGERERRANLRRGMLPSSDLRML